MPISKKVNTKESVVNSPIIIFITVWFIYKLGYLGPHECLSPASSHTPQQCRNIPRQHHRKQTKKLFVDLPINIFISAWFIYKLGHLGTYACQPPIRITVLLYHGHQEHPRTASSLLGHSHRGLHHDSSIISQAHSKAARSPVGCSHRGLFYDRCIVKTSFTLAMTATKGSDTTPRNRRTSKGHVIKPIHSLAPPPLGKKWENKAWQPQASKGVQLPMLSLDSTYGGPWVCAPGGKFHMTYTRKGLATAGNSSQICCQTTSLQLHSSQPQVPPRFSISRRFQAR